MENFTYRPMRKRHFIFALAVVLMQTLIGNARKEIFPRVSIFADHIRTIAQQENISFQEAAQAVRNMGYEGVDVWVTSSKEELKTLNELGFEHASAIVIIDHSQEDYHEKEEQTIQFMKENGFPRVLLVPGLIPQGSSQEILDKMLERIDIFSRRAAAEGLDVMIEDYDDLRSPCYNTEALNRMFKAAPRLSHNFDTGNYLFCGEDPMVAVKHFRKRIHHVHLKDRKALGDKASPVVGTGIVPMKGIIAYLLKKGYKGWFCVEFFGEKHMLEGAQISISNILKTE